MELTIEKAKFHQISLKQISEALKKGLSKNYIEVDISIVAIVEVFVFTLLSVFGLLR